MRRGAFSTGFAFKYTNDGDDEMTVNPAHQSLKEDVLRSGHLTKAQWIQTVMVKAREYMRTQRVREMKKRKWNRLTFRYEEGSRVTKEHIYAIILYCDYGKLCTAFSATFRRQNVFETMESVKQRHSQFANFGRLLVELVLAFGINGHKRFGGPEYQRGPFFCGLDRNFNFGSFALTLRGPCSTSTVRIVALNFATEKGVILKLSNDTASAQLQKFFDCSWISNYPEELERLWIAGTLPLRIVTIVIVQSAKNYAKTMRALYLFDVMLSGVSLENCKIRLEASDCQLIWKLVESELRGVVGAVTEFDEYLKTEWKLFLQSKEKIILKWWNIKREFELLSDFVAFDLVYNAGEVPNGKDNVLKAEWISIFPVVHTVTIESSGNQYKFRLKPLWDAMNALPHSVHTVIVKDGSYWARWALSADIKSSFEESGWAAECKSEGFDRQLVFRLKHK